MIDIEHQLSVNEMVTAVHTAMDEIDDANKSLLHDLGEAIGSVANIVQVAGWVVPWASTAAGVIKELAGGQTEADAALQSIQDGIIRLIKDLHNVTAHVDMEHITERLDDVQVTLDELRTDGPANPNVAAKLPHDAIALLRDFGSIAFWTRPYFEDLVFRESPMWIDSNPPVDQQTGQVLDPALILTGYVRAISMWLCTLALLSPRGRPPELALDLDTVIDRLGTYHDQLAGGIRLGRVPGPEDVVETGHNRPEIGLWGASGHHVGAVDVYGNLPLLTQYWPWHGQVEEWDDADVSTFHLVFPAFQVQYVLGGKARQKALYITQGYAALWATRQHLRDLAGQPRELINPAPCWSLRELFAAVAPVLSPEQRSPGQIQATALVGALRTTVGGVPPAPGQPVSISLRTAISTATP